MNIYSDIYKEKYYFLIITLIYWKNKGVDNALNEVLMVQLENVFPFNMDQYTLV